MNKEGEFRLVVNPVQQVNVAQSRNRYVRVGVSNLLEEGARDQEGELPEKRGTVIFTL